MLEMSGKCKSNPTKPIFDWFELCITSKIEIYLFVGVKYLNFCYTYRALTILNISMHTIFYFST